MTQENPKQQSPLALAFLGDAVYELCARRYILAQGGCPVGRMNQKKVELVKAAAQSVAFAAIEPQLTEEEMAIYKRGRNASPGSTPKNAELSDYRRATGVEALFGYLYLSGNLERIDLLFAKMVSVFQLGEERT